jgi:O-antigen ligase
MVLIALSLIPTLIMVFYRYPLLLFSLFPLVDLVGVFSPDYTFSAGGVLVLPGDPVYFFTVIHLCLCALLQPRKMVSVLKENIFVTIFLAMVALYVVLDTPVYGQSAIGEARKFYFMFLIPLLACVTIRKAKDLQRLFLVIVFAATCVTVVALAEVMKGSIVKSVNSEGALIVALAAFSMLIHRVYRIVVIHPILDRLILWLFFLIAVAQGHRTVWLAVGFGVILALWFYRVRPTLIAKLLIVAVVILAGLSMAIVFFPQTGSKLVDHFEGIRDPYSDPTASWRMEGWREQIDQLQKEGRVLFGEGVGGYYNWQFRGYVTVTVSPHNAYVQTALKFGLFGLAIYGLLAFDFFRKSLTVRKKLRPAPMRAYLEMGILNFGAALAYCLGYGFQPIMLMFFGIAMSAVKLSQKGLVDYPEPRLRLLPNDLRISSARSPTQRPITAATFSHRAV